MPRSGRSSADWTNARPSGCGRCRRCARQQGCDAALSARTRGASVMNGSGWSISKNSCARSTSTAGANGRNDFALLDLGVEDIAHVGAARIGEDGAVAERARPHLETTLEPADDLAVGQVLGHTRQQLVLGHAPVAQAGILQGLDDLLVAVGLAVERVRQFKAARVTERLVVVPQRTAERRPGVGSARRHPQALRRPCARGSWRWRRN